MLGAYQISMSIFGVLMTIIATGLPLIVSRSVAFYNGKNKHKQAKIISAGLVVVLCLSLIICLIFLALKNVLTFAINDQSVNIMLILLPSLIASGIYVVLRGGLWGQNRFFTISFTEFFEQVVRIALLFVLLSLPIGMSAGERSALSLTLSTFASCALVVILYFVYGEKLSNPKGEIIPILKTGTPITLVKTISSLIGSVIAIILPARLMLFGYSRSEALAIFGVYMGMTLPLLMVPSTFISSIAVALVPELSKETNNIDGASAVVKNRLKGKIMMALKSTMAISFVLLPVFVGVGGPICSVLFKNADAGKYLVASSVLMIPMGINQICSSILNAIGLEKRELLNYAIGALALVGCVFFLPQYLGGISIPIAMLIMHVLSAILSLITLNNKKLLDWSFLKYFAICGLILAPSSLLGHLSYNLFAKVLPQFFATVFSCMLALLFTVLLMFVFNFANVKFAVMKHREKRKNVKQKTTA